MYIRCHIYYYSIILFRYIRTFASDYNNKFITLYATKQPYQIKIPIYLTLLELYML